MTTGDPVIQTPAIVPPVNAPATDTQPDKTGEAAKFTQADLDKIIKERLEKAEEAATQRLLKTLGVDSLDSAKKVIKAKQEKDEAELSEVQKLTKKLTEEAEARTLAETALQQAKERQLSRDRASEVSKALIKANVDPKEVDDLVVLLEMKQKELYIGVLGENGLPNEKAMKTLTEKAESMFPKYFKNLAMGSFSNFDGRVPTGGKTEAEKRAGAFNPWRNK